MQIYKENEKKNKVVKDLFLEKRNQRQGNLHDWKKELNMCKWIKKCKWNSFILKSGTEQAPRREAVKTDSVSWKPGNPFLLPWNCKKYEFPKDWYLWSRVRVKTENWKSLTLHTRYPYNPKPSLRTQNLHFPDVTDELCCKNEHQGEANLGWWWE